MPDFVYNFLGGGGAMGGPCAAGPGSNLPGLPNPIALTWPQLLNAQLRLGVYPGGWVADELAWRVYSFTITVAPLAAAGGLPGGPPGGGVVPGVAVGGVMANLAPSPVAVGVDTTERGQLGYHMGTAVGGALAQYLFLPLGAGAATGWYSFHLSRAIANGGVFNFANAMRPDIVIFAVNPLTLVVHRFVVWENKGHCVNFGGLAAIGPALLQAQSLTAVTTIPGNPGLGGGAGPVVLGGPWAPNCHIASQVDLNGVGGNFRVQTVDPPNDTDRTPSLSAKDMSNFLRGYYAPFVEALRTSASAVRYYGERAFRTVELPKNVRLGLDDEIYKAWLSGGASFATEVGQIHSASYKMQSRETIYIHETGISTEVPGRWGG
ncbi:MAG: hypothetical protein QM784_22460 [Polyangiaceae bacterium]